jgi:hypothetical protein
MTHLSALLSRYRAFFKRAALLGCTLAASSLLGQLRSPLCALLDHPNWLTFEILRFILILLDLLAAACSVLRDSFLLDHLPQPFTFVCPLLHVLATVPLALSLPLFYPHD